ncbi:MAG: cadherin-like domain-containing protein, partial [Deltaproteobacteria bacterium]
MTSTGTLSISDADAGQATFQTTVSPVAGNLGTLALTAGGNYTYSVANGDVQSIGASVGKVDSFIINSADGTPKTVSFTVNGANDAPALTGTVATLDGGTEDSSYIVGVANLLAGFTDVDGDTLSVTGLVADHGTVTDNANGTYTITPAPNYNGAMALNY